MAQEIPDHVVEVKRYINISDFEQNPPQPGSELLLTGIFVPGSSKAKESSYSFLLAHDDMSAPLQVRYDQPVVYDQPVRLRVQGSWQLGELSTLLPHRKIVVDEGVLAPAQADLERTFSDPRNHYIKATLVELVDQ